MGQRHQIYVRFPGFKGEGKKAAAGTGIAGFHHQWLYGMTAVEQLAQVVQFYINSTDKDEDGKVCGGGVLHMNVFYGLDRQSSIIEALYSTNVANGYWHYVHNFLRDREPGDKEIPAEILDPRKGDNNDGITIIDLSQGDFRYCFMSMDHLEGEVEVKGFKPLTAKEYLLAYYPEFMNKKLGKKGEGEERDALDDKDFDRVLQALCLIQENSKLLTLPEVKKMFPAMFKSNKRKRA